MDINAESIIDFDTLLALDVHSITYREAMQKFSTTGLPTHPGILMLKLLLRHMVGGSPSKETELWGTLFSNTENWIIQGDVVAGSRHPAHSLCWSITFTPLLTVVQEPNPRETTLRLYMDFPVVCGQLMRSVHTRTCPDGDDFLLVDVFNSYIRMLQERSTYLRERPHFKIISALAESTRR